MTRLEQLRNNREAILALMRQHGVGEARVFGSVARGLDTPDSDVDFLVKIEGPTSPWFPAGLKNDLETLLGQKVDIVSEDGLYWLLRRRILQEALPL